MSADASDRRFDVSVVHAAYHVRFVHGAGPDVRRLHAAPAGRAVGPDGPVREAHHVRSEHEGRFCIRYACILHIYM